VAAIVGHNWSVFIGFTGGRGVATSAGALGALSPWTLVILLPIVFAVMWRTRYVSLGSIVGAVGAPIITAFLAGAGWGSIQAVAYALASGVLVTVAHADNIGRLRAGTERRIGQKERMTSGG
jgi:glycerol-3-phosphate acyltransferase PlsY